MFSWGDLWGEGCHFNLRFSGLLVDCRWKMTLASEIVNVIVQAAQLGKKYVFGKARCDYVEHLRHETRSAVYWSLGRSPLAGCALFARFRCLVFVWPCLFVLQIVHNAGSTEESWSNYFCGLILVRLSVSQLLRVSVAMVFSLAGCSLGETNALYILRFFGLRLLWGLGLFFFPSLSEVRGKG